MIRLAYAAGVIGAFLAVALGAFGAHGLQDRLSVHSLSIWNTAVTYQVYHSLALIIVGLWMQINACVASRIVWAFIAGIGLFCGSLYLLALTDLSILGAITPLGGISFLFGWGVWAVQIFKKIR